jgi:hypothetical protein
MLAGRKDTTGNLNSATYKSGNNHVIISSNGCFLQTSRPEAQNDRNESQDNEWYRCSEKLWLPICRRVDIQQ